MIDWIEKTLHELEAKGLRRDLRRVRPLSAREIEVDGRRVLNFSSNSYLGLVDHPALKTEAAEWLERYGTGSGASRLVTGSIDAYNDLETRIADWKGAEAALIFGSGYMANVGCLAALANRDTDIFADKLNHASLNDGCQLSRANLRRYAHNDLDALERLLSQSAAKRKLIVSDTVFSMDGDSADIQRLTALAKRYDAFLYLDDAHGTGVFGANGAGLAKGADADIVMGTFSKAMGSYGAYVACSKAVRDFLLNKSGSFVYTTAPAPAVCGAISAAIALVQAPRFAEVRAAFLDRTQAFHQTCRSLGLTIGPTSTPITPIILGEPEAAINASKRLLDAGLLGVAIRPPTVPRGSSRIRLSLTAAHTQEDIDRLADALKAL